MTTSWIGVFRQAPGQRGMDIHPHERLTEAESAAIRDAIARFGVIEQRAAYAVLKKNHMRLIDMLQLFENTERFGGTPGAVSQRSIIENFMNDLLNWVISTRFYLEVEREYIRTTYGTDSMQMGAFNSAVSREFDARPGYRFTYNLRDYAQHGGIPLTAITLHASDSRGRRLVPYVSRESLLATSFNWSKHARKIIDDSDGVIHLMPMIDDTMDGFDQIEREVLRLHISHAALGVPTLQDATSRRGHQPGHAAIFSLPDDGTLSTFSFTPLPHPDALQQMLEADQAEDLPTQAPIEDPLAILNGPQRSAARRASAAISALLVPDYAEHERIVNRIIEEDQDVVPLIQGLSDIARLLLVMLSQALGTSPEAMLGSVMPSPEV